MSRRFDTPIQINAGSPVAGKVWTASDTVGNGSWQAASVGSVFGTGAGLGKTFISDASGNLAWQDPRYEDILQAGIVGSIASTGITATVNSSTSALTFSQQRTNDIMWFKLASGLLIPGVIPAMSSLTAVRPTTAGNFRYIAIDCVPPTIWGGNATLTVNEAGADQTTAALASTNPTSVTSGNVRIWDGIVQNSATTTVLVSGGTGINTIPAATGRDRCPWARGAMSRTTATATVTNSTTTAAQIAAALNTRIEVGANPLRLSFTCIGTNTVAAADGVATSCFMDGSQVDGVAQLGGQAPGGTSVGGMVGFSYVTAVPAAGSHLFVPVFQAGIAGTASINGSTWPQVFTIEEIVRPIRLNGTA